MKTVVLILSFVTLLVSCSRHDTDLKSTNPPEWAKRVVWYQIFPERFNNGDTTNDPTPASISTASDFKAVPEDWHITPWNQDWYQEDDWARSLGDNFYSNLQLRRYGGDFQGVLDKLNYLDSLGVNAIYFNPINDAPSLHKFDARNWRHMDVNFGPDPEGDMALMETEDPADPGTWKWTSADTMFLYMVKKMHERGMKVIVDYSWNHTGVEFWAFKDVVKNQQNSPYKDWYNIISFDDPSTPENEFKYQGWLNISSLPEIRKTNISGERINGRPYEGNQNDGAKKHIFYITSRWLAPDGDVSAGIDGYRLDVADQIPMGFWREYHDFVKGINPQAYLVGEIWWEAWPDKLMNPAPYVQGDIFDAVMFYQVYRPARYFFAKTDYPLDAAQFADSLSFQWNRLNRDNVNAMMSLGASHDSPRLLTSFYNTNMYKRNAKPADDSLYRTVKPDPETYRRLQLYLMHQFTSLGAPQIWNGDEMGMWGADDPDCRKPLWWPEIKFDDENRNNVLHQNPVYEAVGFDTAQFLFYQKLVRIRKENPVLWDGNFNILVAKGDILIYERENNSEQIMVLFNRGEIPYSFNLPENYEYKDLLNDESYAESISIPPLSGFIIKRATGE